MDSQLEIWKEIPEYDGKYLVSSLGIVKSVKGKKAIFLKQSKDGHGYLWVRLCKGGIKKIHYIHKLVICTFLEYDKTLVSDHINSIRTDNRLINLRQITQSENIKRRIDYVSRRKSGDIGVSWYKPYNKWRTFTYNDKGKFVHIGYFLDKQDAINAYNEKQNKTA